MLSTIVFPFPAAAGSSRAAGPLMRTLAALVPATVDGVVRDVALLNLPASDDLAAVAEEAGCRIVKGADVAEALARAVASARSTALFIVKAGAVPSRLFGEEVARALDGRRPGSGSLVLRQTPAGAFARAFPRLSPAAGVILPRARLDGANCQSFAEVVRRGRPARSLPTPAAMWR